MAEQLSCPKCGKAEIECGLVSVDGDAIHGCKLCDRVWIESEVAALRTALAESRAEVERLKLALFRVTLSITLEEAKSVALRFAAVTQEAKP